MLKQYTISTVFGSEILLFGTYHNDCSNYSKTKETDLYECLEEFSPSFIMMELTESQDIKEFSDMYSDIDIIHSYIKENNAEYSKYDLPVEYAHVILSRCIFDRPENTEQARESRYELSDKFSTTFKCIMEKREESLAFDIINKISNRNKIAIHCGYTHYPAINEHIRFLSDNINETNL